MHPIAPWHISLVALGVFCGGYVLLAHPQTGDFTPFKIRHYPAWVDSLIFWSGLVCLLLVTLRVSPWRARVPAGLLLSVIVILQTAVQLGYGTWVVKRNPTPSLEQMNDEKRSDLAFRFDAGYGMFSSNQVWDSTAFAAFSPAKTDAPPVVAASAQNPAGRGSLVTTRYSSFNRLVVRVEASTPGLLTLSVPYSPQWSASVKSQELVVRRSDRKGLAVFLPAGTQDVEFSFHSPASVVGMLISCVTGLVVALFFSRLCRPRSVRIALALVAIVVLGGGFGLWEHSLYSGDNLGLQYSWSSPVR